MSRFTVGLGERLLPPHLRGDFRHLWSAAVASNLGDGILLAAGPLLVASISREPLAVGFAVFVQQLPWLLFSLLSGVVVDRIDRRRLVIVVTACRALVMVVLTAALLGEIASLPLIYGVLFLLGTGETLGDNVSSALVATSVESSRVGDANSRLFSTLILTNDLLGPPIGAFLFAAGAAVPFGVYAVLALAAAVLLSRLTPPVAADQPARIGSPGIVDDIDEGLRWLWGHRGLRTLALAIAFMNVTYVGAFATWVLFTQERLGLPAERFGLMLAITSVGALVGPLVYGRLNRRIGAVWLLRIGLVVETLTHLALALTRSVWVAGAVMLVFGVHAMVWGTVSVTVRQQATPAPLLGRVTSVYLLASVGGSAVGALLGGVVAQQFGLTAPFWGAFALMVVISALAWRPLSHVRVETLARAD